MGLDRPYWVEDPQFSFDHHIKHIALPSPGDKATLCEVAAHLYCKHLDRSRPLWEIWLIEGLEDGKYAYLQKLHHCMMDGEGAFKMIETICDFEPDPRQAKTVDKAISEARAWEGAELCRELCHCLAAFCAAAGGGDEEYRGYSAPQGPGPAGLAQETQGGASAEFPRSPSTARSSSDRAMTFATLPMAQLKSRQGALRCHPQRCRARSGQQRGARLSAGAFGTSLTAAAHQYSCLSEVRQWMTSSVTR